MHTAVNQQVGSAASPPESLADECRVRVLADDLTGACDSAVAFAIRGFSTEVIVKDHTGDAGSCAVRAYTTSTRDVPADEIELRLAQAVAELHGGEVLFKKIDSVFRGNTLDEIVVTLRLLPDLPAVLGPAFPAMGRTSSDGAITATDLSGAHRIEVVQELRRRGLEIPVLPAGPSVPELAALLDQHWRTGTQAVFCDAETDDHLRDAVLAARLVHPLPLWIGSAGLAHALSAILHPGPLRQHRRSEARGRLVFVIGSTHPVTLAQVVALRDHAPDRAQDSVTILPVIRGVTTSTEIVRALSPIPPESIGCLFVTGGDTAGFLCHSLQVHSLRIEREFAPGVPEGRIVGGPLDRVPFILKSGGFGESDLLCRIVETFGEEVVPSRSCPSDIALHIQNSRKETLF